VPWTCPDFGFRKRSRLLLREVTGEWCVSIWEAECPTAYVDPTGYGPGYMAIGQSYRFKCTAGCAPCTYGVNPRTGNITCHGAIGAVQATAECPAPCLAEGNTCVVGAAMCCSGQCVEPGGRARALSEPGSGDDVGSGDDAGYVDDTGSGDTSINIGPRSTSTTLGTCASPPPPPVPPRPPALPWVPQPCINEAQTCAVSAECCQDSQAGFCGEANGFTALYAGKACRAKQIGEQEPMYPEYAARGITHGDILPGDRFCGDPLDQGWDVALMADPANADVCRSRYSQETVYQGMYQWGGGGSLATEHHARRAARTVPSAAQARAALAAHTPCLWPPSTVHDAPLAGRPGRPGAHR